MQQLVNPKKTTSDLFHLNPCRLAAEPPPEHLEAKPEAPALKRAVFWKGQGWIEIKVNMFLEMFAQYFLFCRSG